MSQVQGARRGQRPDRLRYICWRGPLSSGIASLAQIVTRLQFRGTENQFTVQKYRKPVYSTSVHKTSLQYNCTENQFKVQMYMEECTGTDITH